MNACTTYHIGLPSYTELRHDYHVERLRAGWREADEDILQVAAEHFAHQDARHMPMCRQDGWRECVPPNRKWVTLYEVTQHKGGPEEGGWWYYWREPVKTIEVLADDPQGIEAAVASLQAEMEPSGYEARGFWKKNDYDDVRVEDEPQESATRERPYYC